MELYSEADVASILSNDNLVIFCDIAKKDNFLINQKAIYVNFQNQLARPVILTWDNFRTEELALEVPLLWWPHR